MANSTSGHQKLFIGFSTFGLTQIKTIKSSEPLDFDELVVQLTPIK